MLRTDI